MKVPIPEFQRLHIVQLPRPVFRQLMMNASDVTPGIDGFGVLLSTRISSSVESHSSIPQGFDLDHDCEDAAVILLTQRSWTEKDC